MWRASRSRKVRETSILRLITSVSTGIALRNDTLIRQSSSKKADAALSRLTPRENIFQWEEFISALHSKASFDLMPVMSNELSSTGANRCPLCGEPLLENSDSCTKCDWVRGYRQPRNLPRNPRDFA